MPLFSTILCCIGPGEKFEQVVEYAHALAALHDSRLVIAGLASEDGSPCPRGLRESLSELARSRFSESMPSLEMLEGNLEAALDKVVRRYCADIIVTGPDTAGKRILQESSHDHMQEKGLAVPVLVVPGSYALY